jgi:hypothetical protein
MATPFPNISGGSEDVYNFYHSQLRICIECCFGQLVHHWGILRTALLTKMQIVHVICLVNCLARLHNFCIDDKMQCGQRCCTDLLPEDKLHIIFGHG